MFRLTQILAAALLLLAVALGAYAWWLGGRTTAAPAGGGAVVAPATPVAATFPVVVTTRRVAAGETLAADALRVVRLPIDPPGVLREVAAATGRVPVAEFAEGALVTEAGLATGFALRVAEGERAVAIRADEVLGVANRVQPGDFVDVFVLLKTDGREVARSQARLLLSRQRVLAYGAASVDGLPATDGGASGAPAQARPLEAARTAVLAVPVEDVARLALGEANGRLLLALRHPGDTARPDASLFAALPTALRPVAGAPSGTGLRPIDRAQAGLAMADLSEGGGPAAPPSAAFAAFPSSTAVAANPSSPSARPRTTGVATPARAGIEIESIRGDRRETVSY